MARETAAAYSCRYGHGCDSLTSRPCFRSYSRAFASPHTALVLCITSELLVGMSGLGNQLRPSSIMGNLPVMYAYIFVIGIVGFGLNTLLLSLQKRLLGWHESYRNEAQ